MRFDAREEQWLVDASRVFWFPVGAPVSIEVVLADGRNWVQQAEPRRSEVVDVELFPPIAPPATADAGLAARSEDSPADAGVALALPSQPVDAGTLVVNDLPNETAPSTTATRPAAWPFFVGAAGGALAGLGCWLGAAALGKTATASTTEAELVPYRVLLVTSLSLWALSGAALVVGGVVFFAPSSSSPTPRAAMLTVTGTFQ